MSVEAEDQFFLHLVHLASDHRRVCVATIDSVFRLNRDFSDAKLLLQGEGIQPATISLHKIGVGKRRL